MDLTIGHMLVECLGARVPNTVFMTCIGGAVRAVHLRPNIFSYTITERRTDVSNSNKPHGVAPTSSVRVSRISNLIGTCFAT